jgi:hypothetical protein
MIPILVKSVWLRNICFSKVVTDYPEKLAMLDEANKSIQQLRKDNNNYRYRARFYQKLNPYLDKLSEIVKWRFHRIQFDHIIRRRLMISIYCLNIRAKPTVDSVMPSFGITGITHCNCFPAKSDGVVKKKFSLPFLDNSPLKKSVFTS